MKTLVRLLVSCALLPGGAAAAEKTTESYPAKAVKMIVPFAPGGPTDVIARVIGQKLAERLGKPFVVENRAGAGGNIGMAAAASAPPDGYTVLVVSSSFVVNPSLYTKKAYDPYKDFAPVTLAAASPNVLVVHPSVPAHTVKELIAHLKANPSKASFASPGVGTTPHLSGELFRLSQGLDLVHVPLNGAGPAITSTVGGHTPVAFTALPPAAPHIKQGALRALAVTSSKRSPALPDVPTMAEAGFPDQEADTLQGILVPAGTHKAIIDLLHREIVAILAMPDVKEKLSGLGFDPVGNTPEEFAARIKTEIDRWAKVIKDAHIKADFE